MKLGHHLIKRSLPLTQLNRQEILRNIDTFIFDCDGVIWKGGHVIPNAPQVLNKLREDGKNIFFATNNSTQTRQGFMKKIKSFDIHVHAEEVFSSSFAAAIYLSRSNFQQSERNKVYVIGESGICDELSLHGIDWIGGPHDNNRSIHEFSHQALDARVGAVVVGLDREINYYKIQCAHSYIAELNSLFIATNQDAVGHWTPDQEWAGGGSMVGCIHGCTGKSPIVVGKPASTIIDYIAKQVNCPPTRMCMVGDRLDTDVLFGNAHHLQTILTLSGVTNHQQLFDEENKVRPDYFINSINDLLL